MVTDLVQMLVDGQESSCVAEQLGLSVADVEAVRNSPLVRLRLSSAEADSENSEQCD